jgi:PHD/YefM family antitoxin component YafN of YafNO toxin-antitoxin module
MIRIQDILSLTEFHRHRKMHMERLHATGRPEILTVNGKAKLVVQDAAAYQELLERIAPNREENSDANVPKKKDRQARIARRKGQKKTNVS